jgi:hypothetical protein
VIAPSHDGVRRPRGSVTPAAAWEAQGTNSPRAIGGALDGWNSGIIPTALMVDSTDWRISLEPAGAGTQIVQTYELTKCPRWWEWILARINPSHIDRSAALTEDLRRIGVIAAAGAPAAPSRTEPQQPRS